MNPLQLNPSAAPVDTFAPVEVRLSQGDQDLENLARGLAEFGAGVQSLNDRLFRNHVQESLTKGQVAAARYNNEEAFKKAVAAGEIKDSDNPWFMVGYRQEVSRSLAVNEMNGFRDWYESPEAESIRNADSTVPLSNAIDAKAGQMLQGRDAYESEAILGEVSRYKASLIQDHANRRSQERRVERATAYQTQVRGWLNGITPEDLLTGPAETPNLQFTTSLVQAGLLDAARSMSKSEAALLTAKAVMEKAELEGNPFLARQILGAVKDGENSLADTFAPELAQHEDRIQNEAVQRMNINKHVQNEKVKAQVTALTEVTVGKSVAEIGQILRDQPITVQQAVLNNLAAVQQDLKTLTDAETEGAKQRSLSEAINGAAETMLRNGTDPSIIRYMLRTQDLAGSKSLADVMGVSFGEFPKQTSVEALMAINNDRILFDGRVSVETVADLIRNRELSPEDSRRFLDEAAEAILPGRAPLMADVMQYARIFENNLAYHKERTTDKILSRLLGGDVDDSAIQVAKDKFISTAMDELRGKPSTPQSRAEYLRKLVDDLSIQYRIPGDAETQKMIISGADKKEYEALLDSGRAVPLSNVEKVEGGWKVAGYSYIVTDYRDLPLVFQSTSDFNRAGDIAAKLGITDFNQGLDFNKRQVELFNKNKGIK